MLPAWILDNAAINGNFVLGKWEQIKLIGDADMLP